jgi:hypothetical protein
MRVIDLVEKLMTESEDIYAPVKFAQRIGPPIDLWLEEISEVVNGKTSNGETVILIRGG